MDDEAISYALKDLINDYFENQRWLGGCLIPSSDSVVLWNYNGYDLWATPIDKTLNELFLDLGNPRLRMFLYQLADEGLDVSKKYLDNTYVFRVEG